MKLIVEADVNFNYPGQLSAWGPDGVRIVSGQGPDGHAFFKKTMKPHVSHHTSANKTKHTSFQKVNNIDHLA